MKNLAVLTGDVVGSTELSVDELVTALDALKTLTDKASLWPGVSLSKFARRGGDEWQIVIDRPAYALRFALCCQAELRRLARGRSSRIAVASGLGALPDGNPDPNAGYGDAFVKSGRLLANMDRHTRLDFAGSGAERAVFLVTDAIIARWTAAQARAVAEMLPPDGPTQAQAAAKLGITRTAVQQALAASDYRALVAAIRHMESPA